ncbi:amino acid adenylation domain-containing protein [Streptomyces sp. NPDC059009]|uniref:amino acid adenylation domain-containing protein n=1 Tax=Streptomyces sp. NPDC059009 TaxID=3346694 RepID=UPI0036837DA2
MTRDAFTSDLDARQWPSVLLPTDRPRTADRPAGPTAVERAPLELPLPAAGIGREELLLAGFAALLHRYTAQDLIAFVRTGGTGRAGQVRHEVTGTATLRELAEAATVAPAAAPGPVSLHFAAAGEDTAVPADREIHLVVRAGTDGPGALELHYDAELFGQHTAARLLAHYTTLLEDAVRDPGRDVAHLKLLTGAELHRQLVEWNDTHADVDHGVLLHEAFQARVAEAPDAIAYVHDGVRTTYRELNERANRLAHRLRSLGVGPDTRVGLLLERSPELVIGIWATLKAGGAYVPLDPEYPAERIASMVEGTRCAVTISRRDLVDGADDSGMLFLEREQDVCADWPAHDPEINAEPHHLCYIIHTSGSTGRPKPIALHHRGVMNNLIDVNGQFGTGRGDAVLTLSSPSFDLSCLDYLGLFVAGATLLIPSAARVKDPSHWVELVRAENATLWNSAPALLELFVDNLEQTGSGPVTSIRNIISGGDWMPVPLPDRVRSHLPNLDRFLVCGGAAEASIYTTLYDIHEVDPAWSSIPYGVAMMNQHLYVLDDNLQPVPPGVTGELCLGGIGVAREYLDRPDLTGPRFVQWSHSWEGGEVHDRIYRTGDMARWFNDGRDGLVEFLGRRDFQVKINGHRVELGEIETVLRSHPTVQATAVTAHAGKLVGYVVAEDGQAADPAELTALAAQKLPAFMVPSTVLVLDQLPLTPNGKVDRKNLPEPQAAQTGAYRAPGTAEETTLCAVFADVLDVERVGLDDDFLALGGDSIRAVRVVTRARVQGLEVTAREVLQSRTVAELAPLARHADTSAPTGADAATGPLLTPGDDLAARYPGLADVWPLTPMQSGMLFESQLSESNFDAYHVQTVFRFDGPVDPARMRAAGQALLDRHTALRTAFVTGDDDRLVQLVLDGVQLPWHDLDVSGLDEQERERTVAAYLADDHNRHFDQTTPPLLRLTLVKRAADCFDLVLTIHHALFDGWSEPLLLLDLLRLYAADGDGAALPAPRGFRDYLAWLTGQDREESARAWAAELAGVDEATRIAPHAKPAADTSAYGEVTVALPADEARLLQRRGAELGVTVNTLAQGAWALLLGELTGRDDVVFGATVAGRPAGLIGVESMVGLFINTVPVRVRYAADDTVADVLTGLQARQTALLDHHHHSLSDLHEALGVDALFDTMVVFQSYPIDRSELDRAGEAAGITLAGRTETSGSNYPLTLIVTSDPDLGFTLQYQPHLFAERAAADIAERYLAVLRALFADTGKDVASAGVLPRPAPQQTPALPATTVPALFAQHVAALPDTEVVVGGTTWTYAELDARANRVAHRLIADGIGAGALVGIDLGADHSDLLPAVLGVLKSGAAYTLSDPAGHGPQGPAPALVLTSADTADATPDTDPAGRPGRAGAAAQVTYTDGERVEVTHGGLVTAALDTARTAGVGPGSRTLVLLAGDADATVRAALVALCTGANVEIGSKEVGEWHGDVVTTTPALLADLLIHEVGAPTAGTVVLTGAVPTGSLVRRARGALPGTRIVTVYGTADAPAALSHVVPADQDWTGVGAVPLGRPQSAVWRAHVLAPGLRPVPDGVAGALYLAGPLAADTPNTVEDPFTPGSRMVRTAVVARLDSAGRVVALGTAGPRLMVRGRPVYAAEIEDTLAAHPDVAQAAVVVDPAAQPGARLLAYVVPDGTGDAGQDQLADVLREFVARLLPAASVPEAFVTVPRLPLTSAGLIDPTALPASGTDPTGAKAPAGRAPRTDRERDLCALFADVLGIDAISIDDDFFALGVNSLKATRIKGRIRRTLGLDVTMRTLFQHSTIADLSDRLDSAGGTGRPSAARPRLRKMNKE